MCNFKMVVPLTRTSHPWLCLHLLLLLTGAPQPACPASFDSIASLASLVEHEDWLVEKVEEYIVQEENRLNNVRKKIVEMSKRTEKKKLLSKPEWQEYITQLVEHPINAFNLIKSWVELSQLTGKASAELFSSVTQAAVSLGLSIPDEVDYKGALAALVRLQKTYSLPASDMAVGKVYNHTALNGLPKEDFFELGKLLLDVDHSLAMSWFQILLKEGVNDTYLEREIHRHKMDIYRQAGDLERAINSGVEALAIDVNNEYILTSIHQLREDLEVQQKSGQQPTLHYYWMSSEQHGFEYYESLCRGDNIKNNILVNKDLICVYREGVLPYVQYKEEIHSFSPRISLFIDVITDKQADMLKQKAFPSLYRATVGEPASSKVSDMRVSKLSWLWDTEPEVKEISDKVEDITGLSTTYKPELSHAEPFQVVNYGIGGQYEPHYDFSESESLLANLPELLMDTGDRIATFMFYLSAVTEGGATVFPNVGVRVPPIKNAAAFWYNFQLDGQMGDPLTFHAGCPVLLGQKWVANKWIRQEGQMHRRPCGLTENEDDPIWYS